MDEEELLRQYHADYQFSFGGLNHIKNAVNIRNQALKSLLANSNIYTEFREFKKTKIFTTNKILCRKLSLGS